MRQSMVTRICDWGIGKWQVHSDELASDMLEAGQMVRKVCAKPDLELSRHSMRHLTNVLRTSPAKAGLGVDLWILRLFAALPIEGLKVLLSLVHLVQQGIIPMQLLVVLIGLMPKESGGERLIALTAMLYRLVVKLNKSSITH